MPVNLNAALAFAQENKARFLSELIEFVSIPSVSTDPAAKPAMQQAAEWVAAQLKSPSVTQTMARLR